MNSLLTTTEIGNNLLDQLDNACVLGSLTDREYDDRFGIDGAKIGDQYSVRKPQKYEVQSGAGIGQYQDLIDELVTINIDQWDHVPIKFGGRERKLSMDDYRRRYIDPQGTALTNRVDTRGYDKLYKNIYNNSGTPAAVPTDSSVYTDGLVQMAMGGAPEDQSLSVCVSHRMEKTLVNAEKSLFHGNKGIERGYLTGEMGEAHGAMWYASNNTPIHTFGTMGGTPVVASADQTGSSLNVSGLTASITGWGKWGDTFLVAGVNRVHPQTYRDSGELQPFVLTADVDSDSGGLATLPISPSIITAGPLKTVTASPAANAALTFQGTSAATSRQGLLFHRGVGQLTIVDLPQPVDGTKYETVRSKKYRMSFQMVAQFDAKTYDNVVRTDIMYTWTLFYAEYGHRIYSLS